jgi:hypothetical protein
MHYWQATAGYKAYFPAILLLEFSLCLTMAKTQLTSLLYITVAVDYVSLLAITALKNF